MSRPGDLGTVTVIIPTVGRADLTRAALESVRAQVGGVTLRHRLPTSVEIAVACVLRLVSQVSRLRARQASPSIEVDR